MNSHCFLDDLNDLTEAPGVHGVLCVDVAAFVVIIDVRIFLELLEFFVKGKIFYNDFFLNLHRLNIVWRQWSLIILLASWVPCGRLRWVHLRV